MQFHANYASETRVNSFTFSFRLNWGLFLASSYTCLYFHRPSRKSSPNELAAFITTVPSTARPYRFYLSTCVWRQPRHTRARSYTDTHSRFDLTACTRPRPK